MIDFLIANGAGLVSLLVVLLIVGGLVVTFGAPHKTGKQYVFPRKRPEWYQRTGLLKVTRVNPNGLNGVSVSYYSGRRDIASWDWDNIISTEEQE